MLDGPLAFLAQRPVAGVEVPRGRDIDDGQETKSDAEEDQDARLRIAE
jgi:hypothetical protein